MKNIDIKLFFSKFKSALRRNEFRSIGAKAGHDWKIMAITFFFVWIAIFAWSFIVFVEIDNGSVFQATGESLPVGEPLSKKQIDDTVSIFEGKKIKLDDLKSKKPFSPDPSL